MLFVVKLVLGFDFSLCADEMVMLSINNTK
jgi:hypothetical protein